LNANIGDVLGKAVLGYLDCYSFYFHLNDEQQQYFLRYKQYISFRDVQNMLFYIVLISSYHCFFLF